MLCSRVSSVSSTNEESPHASVRSTLDASIPKTYPFARQKNSEISLETVFMPKSQVRCLANVSKCEETRRDRTRAFS